MTDHPDSHLRVCVFVPARDAPFSARYARMNDIVTHGRSTGQPIWFDVLTLQELAQVRPAWLRPLRAWLRIIRSAAKADIVHFVAVGWAVMPAFLWVRWIQRKPLVAGPNLYFLQFFTRSHHPDGLELLEPQAEAALARDTRRRRPMQTSRIARWVERLRWRLIDQADAVLALGTFCREVGLVHGAKRDRIDVMPLTAPTASAAAQALDGDRAIRLPTEHQRPVVLYMGALSCLKGFDQFVDLVTKTDDGFVTFVIAGSGPMRHQAEMLAQSRSDTYYLGYTDRQSLIAALDQVDLYVQPSIWDLISTTMLEALRHGVPVLSADIASAKELADQVGDAMTLYRLGDLNELEIKFCETIKNIDKHKASANNIAKTLDMGRAYQHMSAVYTSIRNRNVLD
ncbi:hypothetical protein CCR85_06985 [Rhodothalassium salexigens]|uniref:glycosyltransferase family 4 protein n=1 Tax=Rhodothalassium salexigens TaxID=1086 RepID=UPI0019137781|nr:glycosyltransferase family 4 protein [Rhodothalassium salexigens]MBK5911237.1 hypothetical protein [Rhodothalassium salexigens]MBK5920499.1 hypothetical protein [Rhodothalassium salexigens]